MERERLKLLNRRVKRIRGQISAVERALEAKLTSARISSRICNSPPCAAALNNLMAEVMEDHIRLHLAGKGAKSRLRRTSLKT